MNKFYLYFHYFSSLERFHRKFCSFQIFFCFSLEQFHLPPHIHIDTKWKQNAITIAGGNRKGNKSNQLSFPWSIYEDDDNQSIYIVDKWNHCIVKWKYDAKNGQVVAGGNGQGNRMVQLNSPTDVIVDKTNDCLIICDRLNRRVVQWPRQNGTNGQTIISNIDCWGVTMDNNGNLYVSDYKKHEVRRWKIGDTNGTIVAGGNGKGNHLNQLNQPTFIFVDQDHSVYVSDHYNHRVMKWMKDAKEGIVVAGGQGEGNSFTQLSYPYGVVVDHLGHVYVTDYGNDRIMRWLKGSTEGSIIVGGNGKGDQPNQFNDPIGLCFDRQGHLYVVDNGNNRVQKFEIDSK
jgi:sugar lactone lactonase YvrE